MSLVELTEDKEEREKIIAHNDTAPQSAESVAGDDKLPRGKKKMYFDAKVTLIAIIVASLLIVAAPPFTVYLNDKDFERQAELARQLPFIREYLLFMETVDGFQVPTGGFLNDMELVKQRAPNGQPYCTGIIKPELSEKLPDYIAAYNADPNTLYPVTEDEVRYGLTEGLYETMVTGENEAAYRLMLFFKWCQYHLRAGELS